MSFFRKNFVYVILGLSFFIGLWHGFPMTTIVADEMFGPAALKAMQVHSIFPQGVDVPYGTVFYYVSYIFLLPIMLLLLVLKGFNVIALKYFLLDHPYIPYLVARIVSAFCGLSLLVLFKKVLEKSFEKRTAALISLLLFSQILVMVIFHTSKVWILTTTFILFALYFLIELYDSETPSKKHIFYSLLFSFLAAANFPLAAFSLMTVPFVYYKVRKDASLKKFFVKLTAGLVFLSALIVLSNFSTVREQVRSILIDYTLSASARATNLSVISSFALNTEKIVLYFPILVALFFLCGSKVKRRNTFYLSLTFGVVYFILISVVARWATDVHSFPRYLFPLPFFAVFILAGLKPPNKIALSVLALVSVFYFITTLWYLSVPTTYNNASAWITANLNKDNVVLKKDIGEDFDLAKNKKSALLTKPELCGTRCQAALTNDTYAWFKPLVIDAATNITHVTYVPGLDYYSISQSSTTTPDWAMIATFKNNPTNTGYYSIDALGDYFDPCFFSLGRLGKNVYIYKKLP